MRRGAWSDLGLGSASLLWLIAANSQVANQSRVGWARAHERVEQRKRKKKRLGGGNQTKREIGEKQK
jgi:hypothetical protein